MLVIRQKSEQVQYDIFDAIMDIWAAETTGYQYIRGSLEHLSVTAGLPERRPQGGKERMASRKGGSAGGKVWCSMLVL